ncbi:MAG: Zn-ribbon domain-containing OB-fold protein [Calditrichia bacterium]|nr:Zn-ribbon domain-containing OB-fold protein [Calditrichia bacterium]
MSVSKYWREMPQRYRLEGGKCKACGEIYFPVRLVCKACGAKEFEKIKLSREGVLVSHTVIHIAPGKFTDQVPYAVGIVELKEGVRLLAQIADCSDQKLKKGTPLRIEFRKISEEGNAGILNYGYKCVPV